MRILVLSVSAALIAGAAFAQPTAVTDWRTAPNPAGSGVGPREDDPAYRRFERKVEADLAARREALAATGVLSDVSAVEPQRLAPPAGWTGSMNAWHEHMQKCAARYRTYNAETDMFYSRPGVLSRCRL